MTMLRRIARNIVHYRRMHLGLACGAALACAILAGALIVGDSVDQTLRGIAMARLGRIEQALEWRNRYFAQGLSDRLEANDAHIEASAVLALRGVAALPPEAGEARRQRNRAHILGVDPGFWRFALEKPGISLGVQEAAVNTATARALGIAPGDDLVLRLEKYGWMPPDAPMSQRQDENNVVLRVKVIAVLSDAQLGRISLAANQAPPANVFLDRTWLQETMELEGLANMLIACTSSTEPIDTASFSEALEQVWDFEDIGIRFETHASGVVQVASSRVYLDDEIVRSAEELPGASPTLAYLVNSIAKGERSTPYSFVTAGPVPADTPGDGVIINQWLADTLEAGPGDRITVAYWQLLPSNVFVERERTFTVHRVVPMAELAIERDLAPVFPGLSEVDTCRDWDIGMPLEEEALNDPANEAYWREYGQTPKLMTTFETGRELWGTRFGAVMGMRFPPETGDAAALRTALKSRVQTEALGLAFLPVRTQALESVDKAMNFGGLFLGLSFFLIASALILLGLLFVYGLQQRAPEMGVLKALGYPLARIRTLFLIEALATALPALCLGSLAGAGYAHLLLLGLPWRWPAAVAGAPVTLHIRPETLVLGAGVAFVCVFAVVLTATWRGTRQTARELLTTDFSALPKTAPPKGRRVLFVMSTAALILALMLAAIAVFAEVEDALGPFFSVGLLLLLSGLGYYACFLGYLARRKSFGQPRRWKLLLTNLARRRGRSLGIAAASAAGCFLVLAVSAMRENLALHADRRDSGTGGFALYAETALPVPRDYERLFDNPDFSVTPLRVRDGDDAGCLNLNRAQSPRLIGVDPAVFAALGAFGPPELWGLLEAPLPGGRIPALVGDTDTALWGIGMKTDPQSGGELLYAAESGQETALRLVGRLPMRLSVFQGAILISETDFTRLFPSEGGYRAFLLDATPEQARDLAHRLNREQERLGMDAVTTLERLEAFYAVETAYLALFLVLGGLGLALGAGGAAIVVLRNLFERRAETALLHALGYERNLLWQLLFVENGLLTGIGSLLGAGAATAAILPLVIVSRTVVAPSALILILIFVLAIQTLLVTAAVASALPRNPAATLRNE